MEKNFKSSFYTNWRSPNLNSSAPFDFGVQNRVPAYANPCDNMFSTNRTPPPFAFPHSKSCQPNETRGWFYCVPRFRQAFSPVPNSVPQEKLNNGLIENPKGGEVSNLGVGLDQKRFLVFDQSGDRTTLVFSSGIGGHVQYPPWNPLIPPSNLKKEKPETKRDAFLPSEPFYNDEYNEENEKDDVRSVMREDSEEIDALLYSDDDDDDGDDDNEYSEEDDEVTSTGHSPSTVTAHHGNEEWAECGGEVGSTFEPTKRRKVSNGGYCVPSSLMDTASSVKGRGYFEYEDDAESSCNENKDQVLRELSGKKRSRKEKICETLSVLESIIPGGNDKGKDAIGVIDEAIRYLRSLKVKAKALGFDSLEDAYE